MKSIISGLFILLIVSQGCNLETRHKNQSPDFLGEWTLNEDSYSAISRSCISLELDDDSIARFQIIKHKNNYLVRFNNERNTTWQSSLNRKIINARQIVNTSTIGKLCGAQTEVRLILRLEPNSPNRLIGKLETSTCSNCPDVEFTANKAP